MCRHQRRRRQANFLPPPPYEMCRLSGYPFHTQDYHRNPENDLGIPKKILQTRITDNLGQKEAVGNAFSFIIPR